MWRSCPLFCIWEEDGIPIEHILEIIHLHKADAESIYSAIIDCLKQKNLHINKVIGMGFDGASTFSGRLTGVQARLKKHAPHALFVHCHCHMLQLACVHAANATPGIQHIDVTLTTLWNFFNNSPKRTESLKEVLRILEMPELKIIQPSDTRWLSHERYVKGVKASYSAIVSTLDNIHAQTHEPEALGLSKVLSKKASVSAIYLLDYTLPPVAQLSKTLQSEQLDLYLVLSLQPCTLSPAATWVLELKDEMENLVKATGTKMTYDDIRNFKRKLLNHLSVT